MIRTALLLSILTPFSLNAYAEKIKAECKAAPFEIESVLGTPLSTGKLRAVDQTIAGFLDTDTYSLSITTDCKGRGEKKVCLTKADSHFCRSPLNSFAIKSIKSDNSIIMIRDRCEGSWTKYHLIGTNFENERNSAYMEYQTFFQKGALIQILKFQLPIVPKLYILRDSPECIVVDRSDIKSFLFFKLFINQV